MRKPKQKQNGVSPVFQIDFLWFPSENVVEITECVYTKTIILLLRRSVNILPLFTSISKNNC